MTEPFRESVPACQRGTKQGVLPSGDTRENAPNRWGSARNKAAVTGVQPALCQGHQVGRFAGGVLARKTVDPVVWGDTPSAGHGDRGTEGAIAGGVGHGGQDKLAQGDSARFDTPLLWVQKVHSGSQAHRLGALAQGLWEMWRSAARQIGHSMGIERIASHGGLRSGVVFVSKHWDNPLVYFISLVNKSKLFLFIKVLCGLVFVKGVGPAKAATTPS